MAKLKVAPKKLDEVKKQKLKQKFDEKKDSINHKEKLMSKAVKGDPANPLSGSAYGQGHYEGTPLADVPMSHCTLLQWIYDNSPYECVLRFDWKWNYSAASLLFYDKETLQLVKEYGPEPVTGRDSEGSSNYAAQHMRIGIIMIRDAALWIQEHISEVDGV